MRLLKSVFHPAEGDTRPVRPGAMEIVQGWQDAGAPEGMLEWMLDRLRPVQETPT